MSHNQVTCRATGGVIFRAIRKSGKVWGSGLDESAIWEIVRRYAALVGYPGYPNLAPHDARRSCARIYYDSKAPLKQIQFLLGHDKLDTTARDVNDGQKFGGDPLYGLTGRPLENLPASPAMEDISCTPNFYNSATHYRRTNQS